MADVPGPSGSFAREETLKTEEECKKLLYQGEVMIIRQRYPEAVDLLEDCVKNLARIHGDGSDAIGEAYLYYGRALLGMEQTDESLFQKNVDGGVEDDESSDDEDGDGEENEDSESKEGDDEANGEEEKDPEDAEEAVGAKNSEPDGENTDSPAAVDPEQGEAAGNSASNGTGPTENGSSAEADEQITNMQVAWEVTELARKIFLARGSDNVEDVKKLGRAYATLAEIAMVSGQFAESEADFGRAYDILAKTDDTLREQAEILYLRSNALVSCTRFDQAKEVLAQALSKLSEHQEKLREKTDEDAQKEIEEIESVKDQLKGKFEEIEIAREDIAKFREQKEKLALTNGSGSSKSPVKAPPADVPVRDISHLVRRRKKPDGDASGDGQTGSEGSEAKKPRVDATENGHASSTDGQATSGGV